MVRDKYKLCRYFPFNLCEGLFSPLHISPFLLRFRGTFSFLGSTFACQAILNDTRAYVTQKKGRGQLGVVVDDDNTLLFLSI